MPDRPRRRCTGDPRCHRPALPGGRCAEHARQAERARNARRATSLDVYRSKRWARLRRHVLADHPYCTVLGCERPATDVDHIIRIEAGGDPWARTNLQPLCHAHHASKTARETGFGGAHDG